MDILIFSWMSLDERFKNPGVQSPPINSVRWHFIDRGSSTRCSGMICTAKGSLKPRFANIMLANHWKTVASGSMSHVHGRQMAMYDLIGDIHGHADELIELLAALGYHPRGGVYAHPQRRVIFLGDFIDRGPKIRQTLEIVRAMIDAGQALAVMGNHELNALAFHTADPEHGGEYLRPHSSKNLRQHQQTLDQLPPAELASYLAWFRTLPLWLDLDGLRVVHACWDGPAIEQVGRALAAEQGISGRFLQSACTAGQPLFATVETVLKGKEAPLPAGGTFADKDGHLRDHTRIRWYASPGGHTYRTYALTDEIDCDLPLAQQLLENAIPYPPADKPVFVGHYWLRTLRPAPLAGNVACLDYSVAKGGFLCAYRWDGEQKLRDDHFVWVR
jgi:hypothetical protein